MLIVPLTGDKITTVEGAEFTVLSYTNFKARGPAVYVENQPGEASLVIYFFDIEKINGVKVEYSDTMKLFKSLGALKRAVHLPQIKDTMVLLKPKTPIDSPNDEMEITTLKLHNKTEGVGKGLLICGEDGCFPLSEMIDLKRSHPEHFNRSRFLRIYKEYLDYPR